MKIHCGCAIYTLASPPVALEGILLVKDEGDAYTAGNRNGYVATYPRLNEAHTIIMTAVLTRSPYFAEAEQLYAVAGYEYDTVPIASVQETNRRSLLQLVYLCAVYGGSPGVLIYHHCLGGIFYSQ